MQKLTRRGLIKHVSISAGAVGVLINAIPAQAHSGDSIGANTQEAELSVSTASDEALVVYVNNSATGTLTVLRGEREITIKDATLVQRLLAL